MIGQRMDLLFDNFWQNAGRCGIVPDIVQQNSLLEGFVKDTVNILDGLAAESRLSIMSLRQLVV